MTATTAPQTTAGRKVVLVDGYSLVHRAYYALPPLTTADGLPTNAAYGFTMMLLGLLETEQPDYVAVCVDRPGPTFREEIFPQYKGHRPPMPDDLRPQIPLVEEILDALNIPIVGAEGFEADDLLGTLAAQAEAEGMQVLLVTGDRDCLQLVTPNVRALLTRKGIRDLETFDVTAVREKLGVPPERVPDLKGLVGDTSDNIPGVPKVGPKTALELLGAYGSVEEILRHADEVGGKVGDLLREFADQARVSKELATIRRDAPVHLDLAAFQRRGPDRDRLFGLFSRLEFKTLLERLHRQGRAAGQATAARDARAGDKAGPGDAAQATLALGETEELAAAHRPTAPAVLPVTLVRSEGDLAEALEQVAAATPLALSVLPDGEEPMRAGLLGVALASPERAWYVPLGHKGQGSGRQLVARDVCGRLSGLLSRAELPKACHDAKLLRILLRRHGGDVLGIVQDVMLASYLLHPEQGDHSLPGVALKYANAYLPLLKHLAQEAPAGPRPDPSELPPELVAERMADQLAVLHAVGPVLERRLREDGLWDLFAEVELPLVDVLVDMEMTGIRLDLETLQQMSGEMQAEIGRLTREIYDLAGEEFNINSPKQLGRILFEKLHLPVVRSTKTGPSTRAEVLEELAGEHQIVARLLDYRELVKLKGTYVDALPALVHGETGRVHTSFNQAVTATGRLSSANPNLQNIPVRTPAGRRIRAAFVAEPGYVILSADYSQIELRVLAHISGDKTLCEAFRKGEDIHVRTASEVFGVEPTEVTAQMRDAAKAINFGIVYGISSFGLARGTGLSREDAQRYIDGYFQRYPGVRRYVTEIVEQARRRGYVTTLLGRRRYIPEIHSRKWAVRSFAERTAMNTPIQGTATGDVIKLAMLALHRRMRAEHWPARLLLQVHDELVLEVRAEAAERLAPMVRETMENVIELAVPLVAEVKVGPNWLEAKPVGSPGRRA